MASIARMKAVGAKTPQPISASFSAPPIENAVGTPARLSTLRRDCLARDHNRCVITRAFNLTEAIEREKQDPSNFKDDDGLPLEREEFALLEVAHIIPHSIMSATIVDGQPQLFRLPVTRTLLLSPNHTIDPPSPELLALHRPIAIILHLSAAGQYIEKIIDERDQLWARNDGSTELGHIVSLGLGGWVAGRLTGLTS
ncbi:predicted protein [Histoplasma mississippiense (nom. inval.)]|uniref:predicted protein n=1 Tax=Ajellomyces capsulatus (strain NAm1 / WU24) TaxID=2059318 RepID=UPI000157CF60|nr:predicted protein [Histoplasma mississippiense (nom. inval.)]EDN11387.1 predicted protein [Histoplasma mississippiense (nom. inval.)]